MKGATMAGFDRMPGGIKQEVEETAAELWWIPLISGIFWLIVALIVLRFDEASITTVGILAGLVFIGAGINDLAIAQVVDRWRGLRIVLGLALIVVGVVALFSPGNTFEALAAIIGWYLLFKGTFDIVVALGDRLTDLWWLGLVVGIVEILLAFWAAGYFGRKAVLLVIFVAAAALSRGIVQITMAFEMRGLSKRS
jgi:uncharacterized membrane protein HdeD (DUF308 family)